MRRSAQLVPRAGRYWNRTRVVGARAQSRGGSRDRDQPYRPVSLAIRLARRIGRVDRIWSAGGAESCRGETAVIPSAEGRPHQFRIEPFGAMTAFIAPARLRSDDAGSCRSRVRHPYLRRRRMRFRYAGRRRVTMRVSAHVLRVFSVLKSETPGLRGFR